MSDNESRRCLTTKCALLLPTLAMLLQQFINAGANGTFLLLYGIKKSKHIFSFTGLYYLSIPVLTQLAVKPMEDAANNRTPNATVTIKPQMFALIRTWLRSKFNFDDCGSNQASKTILPAIETHLAFGIDRCLTCAIYFASYWPFFW